MILLYSGIICGVVALGIYVADYFDGKKWYVTENEWMSLIVCSGVNGLIIFGISRFQTEKSQSLLLLSVAAGCLLFACLTDCKSCEVFEFTWWIAGPVSAILLLQQCFTEFQIGTNGSFNVQQKLVPLFLYILLQEVFFCRFYGRADCHAFVVCAVVECGFGMGMMEYLLHMLIAFGFLALVQMLRGNIHKKGNLKQPVAFLPYITFSFWVLLFFGKNVILKRISETIYIGGLRL